MPAGLKKLIARVQGLRAVRVFQRYTQRNGPILAGGLSLTALYSVFAALYVGFAVFGLVIESDPVFKNAVVTTITGYIPGLLDTGNGGAIDLDTLFSSRVLNWGGVIALVLVLVTALSWFDSARSSVRAMFGLPQDTTFFLLTKLKDLGLVVAFAAVTLFSAAISIGSTSALGALFGAVGIDSESDFAVVAARIAGLLLALVIDTVVLGTLFRVLTSVRVPLPRLLPGVLLGGVALGILKALGAVVIGGAGRNPLLASFAVILGLLVWFGLICQVLLVSATWVAVDLADHGEPEPVMGNRRVTRAPRRQLRPRTRRSAALDKLSG